MKAFYLFFITFLLISGESFSQNLTIQEKSQSYNDLLVTSANVKSGEETTTVYKGTRTGLLELKFDNNKNEWITCCIYDEKGKMVYNDSFFEQKNGFIKTIDLSKESKGQYLVEISNGIEKNYKKVMIE
ncbi:MAG: T9SS type A sorting domain-containing protein [Bacteroidota bacterium]